jgi:hypothetical protein
VPTSAECEKFSEGREFREARGEQPVKSGQGEVQMVSNSQEKNPKEKRCICYLESRRCRVVNFLDGLALPAEGQKSHPRQQTRVLEMTSTESHPARLRPTTADHCPYQPSLIKGGGVAEACGCGTSTWVGGLRHYLHGKTPLALMSFICGCVLDHLRNVMKQSCSVSYHVLLSLTLCTMPPTHPYATRSTPV